MEAAEGGLLHRGEGRHGRAAAQLFQVAAGSCGS